MRYIFAIILLFYAAQAAATELEITNAIIRQTIGNNITSAYITIKNNGNENDKLIAAKSNFAKKIEFHSTTIDENEIATMQKKQYINIKKNSQTKLTSGKDHLMLMQLKHQLKPNEKYPITLIFEKNGKQTIMFEVKTLKETIENKHNH